MGKVRVREGELVCFAFLIEKTLSYKFKVFDRLSPVIRVPIPQHTHARAHTHTYTRTLTHPTPTNVYTLG